MFNRSQFNRSKFNVTSSRRGSITGTSIMSFKTYPAQATRIIEASGYCRLIMNTFADVYTTVYNSGSSEMKMSTKATPIVIKTGLPEPATLIMSSYANQTLAGESSVIFKGLELKPGDELVINTCEMTVTINGQNAMEFVSADAEFFSLLKGINEIIYSDASKSRKISLDILWKDWWI